MSPPASFYKPLQQTKITYIDHSEETDRLALGYACMILNRVTHGLSLASLITCQHTCKTRCSFKELSEALAKC